MNEPRKPTFVDTIAGLRCDRRPEFAHVYPTPDEADAADALELVQIHHQVDADVPDADGEWGSCLGCAESWPCPTWMWAEQLAALWLGRGSSRYWNHAQQVMAELDGRPTMRRSA